jgi:hypothetical protein
MKLLLGLVLAAAAFGQVETKTFRFDTAEVSRWVSSASPSPADTRPRFHVWLRSTDPTIQGYRVTVRFRSGDSTTAATRIVANDAENGTIATFPLPDDSAVILSVTRGILREQDSADVPVL